MAAPKQAFVDHEAPALQHTVTGFSERSCQGTHVVFQDMRYSAPSHGKRGEQHIILKGVTGYFAAGQMTALMGPSGSGKTTMLDLLSGRKTTGKVTGSVLFGGQQPSTAMLRRFCGYCEQTDTLVDSLTVEEMLMYTALLKRPMQEPVSVKKHEVEVLLKKLALDSCRATRIGSVLKRGISGGQAKRTNVGIALITSPAVLLLDEPTSGLDSWTANEVMGVIRGIVADGTTIAATIHSPSSHCFSLFHRLIVLVSGNVVYAGAIEGDSIDYFTNVLRQRQLNVGENLAEYIMDFCTQADSDGRTDELVQSFASSELCKRNQTELQQLLDADAYVAPAAPGTYTSKPSILNKTGSNIALAASMPGGGSTPAPGASAVLAMGSHGEGGAVSRCFQSDSWVYVTPQWYSLWVLLQYRTLRNYRSMEYLGPRLFDKIIFAIVIMLLYWNMGQDFSPENVPNMAALMYLCVAQPAWGAVSFIPTIVMERALYVREHNDGLYRPLTYLVFKMIDELFLNWVVGLASCGIMWGGVRLTGSYVYFWLLEMSTLSNGVLIAYAISSFCATMDVANAVVPTILAIMLFLSGFLIRIPSIPVYLRWVTWINMLRYAWSGLMLNQFQYNMDAELGGNPIISYYEIDILSKWGHLGVVAGFFFCWVLLAWIGLAYVKHQKR